MKRTQEIKPIPDPTIPVGEAELTVYLSPASPNFVIKGQEEEVTQLAHQYVAERGKTIGKSIVRAVEAPVAPQTPDILTGRRATVVARLYDLTTGRNMYQLLKQQREDERDLAMAKKLGLITTDRCQKHEKQLATVRGL